MKRAIVLFAACGAKAPPPVAAPAHTVPTAPAKATVTMHYVHAPAGSRWHGVITNTFDMTSKGGAVHSLHQIDKTF